MSCSFKGAQKRDPVKWVADFCLKTVLYNTSVNMETNKKFCEVFRLENDIGNFCMMRTTLMNDLCDMTIVPPIYEKSELIYENISIVGTGVSYHE